MVATKDIHIRIVNKVGRITLTRPQALNALTYDMCLAIEDAVDEWAAGDEVDLILIDAEGDRAFCSGGDIAELYSTGKSSDYEFGRKFWADEYRLNAQIANLSIPYVSIMDGITMGGGVGISAHGSDRIVTERSMIAMPECGIGLVPDVGGSFLLSRAPGHLGEYLAITGYRMSAGDAVLAGFADVQVTSSDLEKLKSAIEETGDLSVIANFAGPPDAPKLGDFLELIDTHFSKANAYECLQSLQGDESEWAKETIKLIGRSCPLSVACGFELIRRVRELNTIEGALEMEYRFTYRSMSDGELIEGIRAQIIDKDRSPQWQTASLANVKQTQIDDMLAPLGDRELSLSKKVQRSIK